MNFVTTQDYRDRYGDEQALRLTNLENPQATTINLTVLQKACDDANNLIEAYVPKLTTVPRVLVRVGAQIVNRFLHIFDPPEGVLEEYNEAMRILRDIAAGKITLETSAGAVTDNVPDHFTPSSWWTTERKDAYLDP